LSVFGVVSTPSELSDRRLVHSYAHQSCIAQFCKIVEIALALDGATNPVAKPRMKDSDEGLAEQIMYYYITKQ